MHSDLDVKNNLWLERDFITEGALSSSVCISLAAQETFVVKWFSVNETHTVNRLAKSMSHKPSSQDPWWLDQDIQIDLTTSPPWGRPGFLWGEATVDCSFSAQLSGPSRGTPGPYLPRALKASALQYWAALCQETPSLHGGRFPSPLSHRTMGIF